MVLILGNVVASPCTRPADWSFAGHLGPKDSFRESLGGHAADVSKPPDLGFLESEKYLLDLETPTDVDIPHPLTTRNTPTRLKNFISAACIRDLILSVIIHRS